ncbi:MAG: pimeloyl-ACP methyl ester carboxylesterase [Rickettsiales bacterium]|jgi:pimeloyl-ACP methyl ester carboxylesterase
MKIYAISGLGADERVFDFLKLDYELVPIKWIAPKDNEDISKYSLRLSKIIDQSEKYVILGVSFGSLIAVEMSKKLNPEMTILISFVETSKELRWIYRLVGKLKLINLIPKSLLIPPKKLIQFLFDAKNTKLLNKILDDTDPNFAKWALRVLLNWESDYKLKNSLKINGTKDKLIPPPRITDGVKLIKDGGHFMVVDKADEISREINSSLALITQN